MSSDEKIISERGVVCWLEAQADGQLRLIMDDVDRLEGSSAGTWKTNVLFTSRDYDNALLLESGLSERELADIGLSVVSRLAALSQKASKKGDR